MKEVEDKVRAADVLVSRLEVEDKNCRTERGARKDLCDFVKGSVRQNLLQRGDVEHLPYY